jgi:ribosomal protein S18 acetylase RimI-like enzyme
MSVSIEAARIADADAVLKLCFLAYQTEALIYDDWSIPPLRETYAGVVRAMDEGVVLVAREGDEIVGSVRGLRDAAAGVEVSRLAVHPRLRRRGIGSTLLRSIETAFDGATRFRLFTGHRSEGNLRLYRSHGYEEIRRDVISPRLTLIVLAKQTTRQIPFCPP